jgi:O-methyltransferase involved in polyketide biosynthesis
MDILNSVSETALITLKARVQEAEKDEPVIQSQRNILILADVVETLPLW